MPGSAWNLDKAAARLERMARDAARGPDEVERSGGDCNRGREYHARYAQATLCAHLAGHSSLSGRDGCRKYLLFLMDNEVMSPACNALALNEGRYRAAVLDTVKDFFRNV